jgi:hypothetical protein
MKQTMTKLVYWVPRVLSTLFVVFLALMSLDAFETTGGVWAIVLALFMHNIPTLLLLGIVLVAWRHELVGAIGFFGLGILYIVLVFQNPFEWYYLAWAIEISGLAFIVGALFWIGWKQRRYANTQHSTKA